MTISVFNKFSNLVVISVFLPNIILSFATIDQILTGIAGY